VLKTVLCLISIAGLACAEVHTLTLKQAVEVALKQNADVVLARLDEQKASAAVRIARDPFVPKVYGGSGLAFTSGYPSSIEGAAQSIFQARTDMALFNRPKSYELAEARENARGAAIDTSAKIDDVAYRTADLFLDASQTAQSATSLQQELQSLERVSESVRLRVTEGRDIALAGKRAELDLARARQRHKAVLADLDYAEESLAMVLGYPDGDRVHATQEDVDFTDVPGDEEQCVAIALQNNKDIRRLQSQLQAKALEVRAQHAARLPQFDLVAQYSLFAKRNYQDFFLKFQRNNGQLGVAIKVPILIGTAPSALEAQAQVEAAKLRTQVNQIRNRTALDTRKSYQDIRRAETGRDVAKMDLEVAREQVTVLLAQLDEGRTTRQGVEEARFSEQEKWIAFYDSQHALEKAKLNLLKQTGTLQTALK
jgi:outer membrane protein